MTEKMYIRNMTKDYPRILKKLEDYVRYCLRCLHRVGIHPTPTDFALLSFVRKNNRLAEAVVYPANSIKQDEIFNPLFFYGFKAEYNFTNLEYPIEIIFSEDYDELRN